jgi:hypothetical protein
VACKHCSATRSASNITDNKDHLLKHCPKFLASAVGRDLAKTVPEVKAAAEKRGIPVPGAGLGGGEGGSSSASSKKRRGQQSMYEAADSLDPEEERRLQRLLAKAVYCTAQSLSMFEHETWIEFFAALRPAFKLPSR